MSVLMEGIPFVNRQPLPKDDFDYALDFVPPVFWHSVYKTFYFGYHAAFSAISRVVHRQPSPTQPPIPTAAAVLAELKHGGNHSLDARGVNFFLG